MKKRIKNFILALVFATSVGGSAAALIPTHAYAADNCTQARFLTFPAWYNGLTEKSGDNCNVISPDKAGGISKFITKIVLNVLEILLQLVGYISVAFIIYGGFLYMTSQGEPSKMTGAKNSILNAVIGLVISIMSVAIVNIIALAV